MALFPAQIIGPDVLKSGNQRNVLFILKSVLPQNMLYYHYLESTPLPSSSIRSTKFSLHLLDEYYPSL